MKKDNGEGFCVTYLIPMLKKTKSPLNIILIFALGFANDYFGILEPVQIVNLICVILIALVFLSIPICYCIERICIKDENIEKEKTNQILATEKTKQVAAKEITYQKQIDSDKEIKKLEINNEFELKKQKKEKYVVKDFNEINYNNPTDSEEVKYTDIQSEKSDCKIYQIKRKQTS